MNFSIMSRFGLFWWNWRANELLEVNSIEVLEMSSTVVLEMCCTEKWVEVLNNTEMNFTVVLDQNIRNYGLKLQTDWRKMRRNLFKKNIKKLKSFDLISRNICLKREDIGLKPQSYHAKIILVKMQIAWNLNVIVPKPQRYWPKTHLLKSNEAQFDHKYRLNSFNLFGCRGQRMTKTQQQ